MWRHVSYCSQFNCIVLYFLLAIKWHSSIFHSLISYLVTVRLFIIRFIKLPRITHKNKQETWWSSSRHNSTREILAKSYWMTDWLTYLLTYLLTDWLTYLLTYWWTDWLTYLLTYLLTNRLTDWLNYLLTYWRTDWLTYLLTYWRTDLLTYLLTDWLTDWLTYLLTDGLTDWLTYLLTYWRTDWLTDLLTYLLTYLITYLLTYSLTQYSTVLLEMLTGLQPVKKFPTFYGTRRFITAVTSIRHLSLFWASSIQSIPPYPTSWRYILILSSHLRLGLPSDLFPSGRLVLPSDLYTSGFPTKTLYTPLLSPYALHAPPISFFEILSSEQYGVSSIDH